MAMTQAQIDAELRRKKAAGIMPTSSANMDRYNAIQLPGTTPKPPAAPKPTAPAAGLVGVRDYLTNQGIGGIGFDNNSKSVSFNGGSINPSQIINGTSYASQGDLDNAILRARSNQNVKKVDDLLGKYEAAINQPVATPQFNYDPESDPVYQAALRRAQANAQSATGNAMAEMNRRGLLNSTIMGDRAAQIQQGEFGRVSDEILPRLIEQAYARHRDTVGDEYTQRRDAIRDLGDMLGITNDLGRQHLDDYRYNDETSYARGRDSLADTRYDDEISYGRGRDAIADERYVEETMYSRGRDKRADEIDDRNYRLDVQREGRISSNQSRGGSSGGSSGKPSTDAVISDMNMPRTAASMETYIINNIPGGKNIFGPPSPDQTTAIENMILSNPNLSEADYIKLYKRFGIPLPE